MARSKKILTVPALHVIAQAVEPLRVAAVAQATEQAKAFLATLKATIDAQPELDQLAPLAPYADRWRYTTEQYVAYKTSQELRDLIRSLTDEPEEDEEYSYLAARKPTTVFWAQDKADEYVIQAAKDAEHNFVVYALKLIGKVEAGDLKATTATLSGDSHLWAKSTLTVTLTDGTVQRWFTRMIWNRSKLGTVFNQFPTRLLKK